MTQERFIYDKRATEWLSSRDEALGAAIASIGMIERRAGGDLFEMLISSVISQQISTKAARTIKARMSEAIGRPTPEAVAAMSTDEIQAFGMSFRKAEYIKSTADSVISGALDIASLRGMSDADVAAELSKLRGIGVWTAEMLMIFAMQRQDILSWGDLGIHRGMRALYGHRAMSKDGKISRRLFEAHRRIYSPYGSVASLYLWEIAGGAGGV